MTSKTLPLHSVHAALEARFIEEFGLLLPNVYTSTAKEYEACKKTVGILDRSCWDKIKVSGKDSVDLLHRLTTNDLAGLPPGTVTPTVFTNEQGRIVEFVSVHRCGDFLLLVASPQSGEKLSRWIDKFIFLEEVRVEIMSDSMGIITLIGPETQILLEKTFKSTFHHFDTNRFRQVYLSNTSDEILIASAHEVGNIGINLISEKASLTTLWTRLLEEGKQIDALPIGWEAFNTLRIEKGVPLPGRELREEINPLEANLVNAVSFTKGCYVGQEVIARLDTYKKLQKRLCRVALEEPVNWSAESFANIFVQNEKIGWITSLASLPDSTRQVGLAYIRSQFLQPDLEVTVKVDGEEARAHLGKLAGNQD